MLKRLINLKVAVNEVLTAASVDILLASEWNKLDEIVPLLEPFAVHTDILQLDTLVTVKCDTMLNGSGMSPATV